MQPNSPWWVLPGLGTTALAIFAGALVGSCLIDNETLRTTMFTTAGAIAMAVVQYFFGSSAGSQKKDDTIARQAGNAGAAVVSSPGGTDDTIAVAVGAAAIDASAQPAQR